MKYKTKIGLSLMIALMFILPTGAVLADDDRDADSLRETIPRDNPPQAGEKQIPLQPIATLDQATSPVIEQDTFTGISGFYLETCVGDTMYPVPADAVIPFENCYEPMFKLETIDVSSVYEPEIEIYKMNADQDFCLYKTSFEDNARNYLEWGQIDKDCYAPGGYYDGWAWSDARACGSDHSFKCTMYDEYKNMQDDVLYLKDCIDLTADEFELCDGSIVEIDTVGKVKVQFDIFVDGERNADTWTYSNPSPLDYLQFGFYDCSQGIPYNGDTINYNNWPPAPNQGPNVFVDSSDIPIDNDADGGYDSAIWWSTQVGLFDVEFGYDYRYLYDGETTYCSKIDGCPGWWHVEYETTTFPDDLGIFFEWRSDKERVYEGAYVDNVEIDITEDVGEKIYQGHSQNWLTQEETGIHWFTFPLDWDDDIEVSYEADEDGIDQNDMYYKAICKIKDDSGGYYEWKEIDFEIGTIDECTVKITNVEDDYSHDPIPDGGIMQYPSDAHIEFCYTNNGNLPVTDTEITATGYKLEKETLFEDDFESMFNWVSFNDDHPLYVSDKFAFSGGKSLAFNQPENDMIVGGSGITAVEYIGYSQDFFSMENVEDAVLDFYWKAVLPEEAEFWLCMIGYHYIILTKYIMGPDIYTSSPLYGETPICQKTWIGPMQPQGMYMSIDFDALFDLLVANDYMKDENGHETYETAIGFFLDTTNVNKEDFVPECCFEPGEVPWSGVYIDDISVEATVKGDAVWSDSMIIPGPCEPGEKCCDQFNWEDVPYSNYIIEVGTHCDEDDWEIRVLENLEQASKVDGVDYTECEPTAWCISDVVGNDCGNDHYALATNCETNTIPEGANDYIGLENIDVSHLTLAQEGVGGGCDPYEQPLHPDQENSPGTGSFSDIYYDQHVYDNIVAPYGPCEINHVEFAGMFVYGDNSPDGAEFEISFYPDDGTGYPDLMSPLATEDVVISDYTDSGQTWLGYTVWIVETDISPVTVSGGDWFSAYHTISYAEDFAVCDDDVGYGDERATCYDDYYGWYPDLDYDWSFGLYSTSIGSSVKGIECEYVIEEGFEDGIPGTAEGWTNTGWLWDYYGAPCEGSHWAFSWAMGDTLTTPTFTFGNESTTLTFQKAVDSATHPMDFEVYVDSTLVYADYGFTNTDCEMVTVPLGNDGLDHTVSFVGQTSDFYGQILDDIKIERCNVFGEPYEGDYIWFNMTYQCDIRDTMGGVILEIATFEVEDDGYCSGCSEEYACPDGVDAWEQIAEFNGNAPGICQYANINLVDPNLDGEVDDSYFDINDTHFCMRLRLETDEISPFRDIPGIGFHVHELSISNILYDEIYNETSDFVEDFEDANFVNEESGLIWNIDCVTFGEHVLECDDFKFCIADECPVTTPYPPEGSFPVTWTLHGEDSYGDGWWYNAVVDVYVNDVLVINDFDVAASEASTTFDVNGGDEVVVEYYTENGYFENEHYWEIIDDWGNVFASYQGVQGDYVPFTISETITVPTETTTMNGKFPSEPIDEAIVWSTEIEDAYEAFLTANWEYDLPAGAELTFEISADDGDNWYIIAHEEGAKSVMPSPIPGTPFDLTPWAGNSLLIRVRLINHGVDTNSDGTPDTWYDGYVCVNHVAIQGKQDRMAPTTTISLSGNSVGPGMYAGPVTVTINAKDDHGMGQIHYILDGTENVVNGNKATFTVSEDGDHTIEYWAVDATGNEGSHGTVSFSIDNSPPTVSLTAPEPGLYLFGNKLLSMSKPFIIGAFTASATAEDAQGVAVVRFLLNGEVVGEDTQAPYDVYIAQKNMGAATLEAVALDGVGNTASDSMDITYYKFL